MGAKSEELAKQFEAKSRDALATLEKLSDADWQKVTEAEKTGGTVLKGLPPMTTEQLIVGALLAHIDEHYGSIRKTVGR